MSANIQKQKLLYECFFVFFGLVVVFFFQFFIEVFIIASFHMVDSGFQLLCTVGYVCFVFFHFFSCWFD
jgi:hypothetical protein